MVEDKVQNKAEKDLNGVRAGAGDEEVKEKFDEIDFFSEVYDVYARIFRKRWSFDVVAEKQF